MSIPVSVILPTYNRAHLLPRAIGSVLMQTYPDFELIVVDDASLDNTPALVLAFTDERVRYLRQANNGGVAAARNAGIAASTGQFLAFQDSDDLWHPHKLARQMQAWSEVRPETAVIYSQFWRQKGKRRTLFPTAADNLSGNIIDVLLWQNVITTQAALVRRASLAQAGGFDEQIPCLVDWELWLRMACHSRFHFLAEPLVTVQSTPNSVSVRETAAADALVYILRKHAALFRHNSRLLAHHNYQIGHLRCVSGNRKAGLAHLETAVRLAPLVPRYRLTWGIAHMGTHIYRQIYHWKSTFVPEWY